MNAERLFKEYDEGGISTLAFVAEFINLITSDNVEGMMRLIPNEAIPALREFLLEYRPDMRTFKMPLPAPSQVALVEEWMTRQEEEEGTAHIL